MDSFISWAMLEHQKKNKAGKRKSKLLQISDSIDWDKIRVHLESMYDNTSDRRWKA